ncbi:hypothetical protein M3Y97_01137400 [Aphelenchoides bicaudatus]|nr:hypothetical protein M3Y97_01137400 [Aphelenchoides bicaudatus]
MKSTKREAIKKILKIAIPWYLDKKFDKATPFVVCLFMVANVVNIGLSYMGCWEGFFPSVADLKQSSNVLNHVLFILLQPFQHANFWMMAVLSGVAIVTQLLVLIGKLREIPSLYKPLLNLLPGSHLESVCFGMYAFIDY